MTANILCFGALQFTVVAQQRLRRCISLGGASGATNCQQRLLLRRNFVTGGACSATLFLKFAPRRLEFEKKRDPRKQKR